MINHAVFNRPLDALVPTGFEQAIFGMGCYWGPEKLFWQQPGIWLTQVGFAGGHIANPTYDQVCAENTGHAEVVHIAFDPTRISYGHLLKLFWDNHDPTQSDEAGYQYRSLIMYYNDTQCLHAKASKTDYDNRLAIAGKGKITTQILPVSEFYPAQEEDHQQYLYKHPDGFCAMQGTGVEASMPEGYEIP